MAKRTIRKRRKPAEWRREVAAWKRSGQTAREYAASRDLSEDTLTWWNWRLKRQRRDSMPAAPLQLLPAHLLDDDEGTAEHGEQAERTAPRWELQSAAGHTLRVESALSDEQARIVIEALCSDRKR
jgi:hypothetical protein